MTYKMDAVCSSYEDDGYSRIICFSNDEDNPSRFVIFQKSKEHDAQDKALGMEKIHVQIEDESRSLYGGVIGVHENKDSILILLNEAARQALSVDGDIHIAFCKGISAAEEAIAALRIICAEDGISYERG